VSLENKKKQNDLLLCYEANDLDVCMAYFVGGAYLVTENDGSAVEAKTEKSMEATE